MFSSLKNTISKIKNNHTTPEALVNTLNFATKQNLNDLQVFHHHIYELKKGLRNLVLTTEKTVNREAIEDRLIKDGISYVIHNITDKKINVYFGKKSCIDVITTFDKRLSNLSPEQDYILGIMLGYDRLQQCDRYLKMREKNLKIDELIG